MMTPEQQQAQANVLIELERETEALVREQHTLYQAALAAGTHSHRREQINGQRDRIADTVIRIYDRLSDADATVISHMVNAAIPDQWYHIPHALPPEEK